MNKDTIIKILTNKSITQQEVSEFIVDYCKKEVNKDISSIELSGILQLIQIGRFNLNYAARQAALKEDIDVVDIIKDNMIIYTIANKKDC